jgi:uncharacterized protein involved in response to NO
VLLILIIAGRIVPFFTERAIAGTLIIKNHLLEGACFGSALAVFFLQWLEHSADMLAFIAVIAALLNALRLASWYVPRVRYVPLLWVLFLGYSWIIIGFALTAAAAMTWLAPTLAIHAFTVGGIGVLTLGMMARVALGHTGRALRVSNSIALAFVALNAAALLRVVLPIAFPDFYNTLVYFALLAWLAAFALFVLVYLPILTAPRADGKEG